VTAVEVGGMDKRGPETVDYVEDLFGAGDGGGARILDFG
jgi:hypothetical protein